MLDILSKDQRIIWSYRDKWHIVGNFFSLKELLEQEHLQLLSSPSQDWDFCLRPCQIEGDVDGLNNWADTVGYCLLIAYHCLLGHQTYNCPWRIINGKAKEWEIALMSLLKITR